MKVATVILSLASLSFASPAILGRGATLTQRDGASIASALGAVDAKVNALNAAIGANPPVPSTIISGADAVNAAIEAGIAAVKQSAALSDMDALNLISPTQTLSADTNKTITNLIAVKSPIDALGYGCLTLQKLQSQFAAAQEFSADIVALVPAGLQSTAQGLSAGIAGAIQNGINAYSGDHFDDFDDFDRLHYFNHFGHNYLHYLDYLSHFNHLDDLDCLFNNHSAPLELLDTTTQPPSSSSTQPPTTSSTSSATQSVSTTTSTSTQPSRTTCSSAATATATATATVTQVGPTVTATVTKTVTASAPPKTTCHQTTVTSIKTVTKTTTRIEPWWCDDWW
ncbi:hypothetical protein NQ176_g730 [Zarea fungicola]|uniref:Uncharacterized protein n=1 Tax=Zarea fungicola TaxID=93591 RepID=A0ACC1NXS8_9HYPO|nr:hypothetical protein NQ176_g730 [Lecanicillium fungicola]